MNIKIGNFPKPIFVHKLQRLRILADLLGLDSIIALIRWLNVNQRN